MRRSTLSSALAAVLAGALISPAIGQMVMPKDAPGKADPKAAKSGTYTLDPAHS